MTGQSETNQSRETASQNALSAPASPYATVAGTTRYRARFGRLADEHFRQRFGLWLSSIGLGSYLEPGQTGSAAGGDESDELTPLDLLRAQYAPSEQDMEVTDSGYAAATARALALGCNVLDTASNYRGGLSEEELGKGLRRALADGIVQRDEVILCTKGGYLDSPLDSGAESLPAAMLPPGEVVNGQHCLAPAFLQHQLGRSLDRMGVRAIDVYYLHNPETQLLHIGPAEFKTRLRRAFEHLEQEAAQGRIRLYGVATWDGLRTDSQDRTYLPLTLLEQLAREVGGEKHRFRFIQFPYNILNRAPFTTHNQPLPGKSGTEPAFGPLLAAAMQMGIAAMTSATLAQGRVIDRLPAQFGRALGEWDTRAQAAIQFSRSTPGVTTALVGMGQVAHVEENMAVAPHPPLSRREFFRLFQRPATPGTSAGMPGA